MTDNPRIEDLRRRVQNDPASIAFAQLAEEYRRARRHQEAVDACRTGLARHPGYLSARVTLGRALLELGQLDEAQRELELVMRGAPDNRTAIRSLAEVHHARGALKDALICYKAALALARNDPDLDQKVADLTRQVAAQRPPDLDAGLSIEQWPQVLSVPASRAPVVAEVKPPAHESSRETHQRAGRTIAALEQWLAVIAANNVARTHPGA